ncbi:MAG: Uma2 family endonuclease [Verrucomicrobiae bacterium]|nr:Uma2 family endonuclease [Verrucomicrobiae bacterium]
MAVQAQHRFNVREYYRMAETGVLPPQARVELLDGRIIDMSPIGPFHGGVTKYLINILTTAARGRWLVSAQDPIHLDDHSEPQPDLMLLNPAADFYRNRHPQPEEVLLLVEISDTTLQLDQEEKLPAYGRAGIAEVWLVNLTELTVEVYREPNFTGYGSKTVFRSGDQARSLAFPDLTVDVAELLRR